MSGFIRDPSTNASMPYAEGLQKLAMHLKNNPSPENKEIFLKIAHEYGARENYSTLMRITTSLDFGKAHLFNRDPQKNNQ